MQSSKTNFKERSKIRRLTVRKVGDPGGLDLQTFSNAIGREEQIIKACLDSDFSNELDKITSELIPEYFYSESNQEIFKSIVSIHRAGKFPEFAHVGADLQTRNVSTIKLLKELSRINEFVEAHISNVDDYISAIRESFLKRKGAEVANHLWKMSVDPNTSTVELLGVAQQALDEISTDRAEGSNRFKFIRAGDLLDHIKPAEDLVSGIIEEKSFIYTYGPSGTYKSFVEIDRGLCIATGVDYHGRKVKQGTVFYIAGEGQSGIYKRVLAWCIKHKLQIKDIPFFVGTYPAQLTVRESIQEIKREIERMSREFGEPALIIFDTLARNFGPGNENDTQDMNTAIHNLDLFRDYLCRSLVAHTGHKNTDRAKGSISLDQAADTSFRTILKGDRRVLVERFKMKEGASKSVKMLFSTEIIGLKIQDRDVDSLVLNLEAEGDDISGAYCINDDDKKIMGGQMQVAFSILQDMYENQKRELKTKCGDSEIVPRVSKKSWIERCISADVWSGKRANVNRGINAMIKHEHVIFSSLSGCVYTPDIMENYDVD